MDWTSFAKQVTRGVIEYSPILLSAILAAVALFCYFSFQRRNIDRVDHFLFSSVAFSVLRTVFSRVLMSSQVVEATGFDQDTAHLIAMLLSLLSGVCFMVLLSLAETLAKGAFYVLALALAWSLIYGNYIMIAISTGMIMFLGCLFIKQRTVAQVAYTIVGSMEYSFIMVYCISEIASRGTEGMEDALADAVSLPGCTKILFCVLRVSAVWLLALIRIAIVLGQKTEAELAKEEVENARIREQLTQVIELSPPTEDTDEEDCPERDDT